MREQGVPLDKAVYRQVLFAVSKNHDHGVVIQVLEHMKRDGLKPDAVDYSNAIHAFDRLYFYRTTTKTDDVETTESERDLSPSTAFKYSLVQFSDLKRDVEQDAVFDDIASEQGTRVVLELFDAMVQQDHIVPTNVSVYARVLMAAVKLQELHRIDEILALHERHMKDQPLNNTAVLMAVNGYLLLDRPDRAWRMLSQHTPSPHNRYRSLPLQAIIDYCCEHKQHVGVLRNVLEYYRGNDQVQKLLSAQRLLEVLCVRVRVFSDAELWQLVTQDYHVLFRVTTKRFWFNKTLLSAVTARRVAIVDQLLGARDRTIIPHVPLRAGLAALEKCWATRQLELMPTLFAEMDLPSEEVEPTEQASLGQAARACFLVVRALHAMGKPSDVAALHAKHQYVFMRADNAVPDDVRQILHESHSCC